MIALEFGQAMVTDVVLLMVMSKKYDKKTNSKSISDQNI